MKDKRQFFVIDKDVLPEVFIKVIEVKKMLELEKGLTVQEATQRVNISRSSFYKYKDSIFPFYDKGRGHTITLLVHLADQSGILSDVLNYIANAGGNVLTINQMIPINGVAIVNICMQTSLMQMEVDVLLEGLGELQGVQDIKILASE